MPKRCQAARRREGISCVEPVELALLDLEMSGLSGVHTIGILHRRVPRPTVVVLSDIDAVYLRYAAEQEGAAGYLVIDGKINDDGTAKLEAKGTVTHNNAHGIFAMKGNNYNYNIKAQFDDTKGTGQRDAGAGVLGRDCSTLVPPHGLR